MSTSVKVGISIICVVALLVATLTFIIKTQITPELVRKTLLPLVESTLHRKVDFGEITIGLFSGISVADFKVMDKGGEGVFFSVETIELRYQLWPLLTGKVVIDQALLDYPQISVVRLPDGQFNFSDLLSKTTASSGKTVSTSTDIAILPVTGFNLLVKEINLNGGELLYVDKFINAKSPYRYTLKDLNFKARHLSLDNPFPVDLSAVVNGANVAISGNYDISRAEGDLTLHLTSLNLVQFSPYYRDFIPGKLGSGRLSMNLEIDVEPHAISSRGTIECDDVDLVLDEFPDARFKPAKMGVNYSLNYDLKKQLLKISTLLLNLNEINIGGEGELDLSSSEPFLVFSLLFDQFDLREVMLHLPLELSRDYQKYSFAGLVDGRIDLAGKLSSGANLFKSAKLSLKDVRASAENLRAGISGDISYENNILQAESLQLQYGDQQAHLKIVAERVDDLLRGKFALTAKILDVNKIVPDTPDVDESSASLPGLETPQGQPEDIGPYNLPLNLIGTLAIDRLVYKKLNIDKITADINLENNYLSVSNLFGKIGGGELKGSSLVNLGVKGFAYKGQMSLDQPNISTLVAGLAPGAKQNVSGRLQWNSNFSGRGIIGTNFLQQLRLKGEFGLNNGAVKGFPLVEGLATFLDSANLKVLSFDYFTGRYYLNNGIARIDGFLDSSKSKLTSAGTVSVEGDLDLKLDARFAPETMNKLGIGGKYKQSLVDETGWGNVPLQIVGTVNHPEIGFDTQALQRIAIDRATEKVAEKILEKIAPDNEEAIEPMKQLLDDTLDRLFNN